MRTNGITLSAARHGRRKLMTSPMRLPPEAWLRLIVGRFPGLPVPAYPSFPGVVISGRRSRVKLAADRYEATVALGKSLTTLPFSSRRAGTDDPVTIVFAESTASRTASQH
jgi:hypothetical protein